MSISKWNAHLSIFLIKISALANIRFAGDKTGSTLLKHAYTTLPYNKTLHTKEFTNYIFTPTFVIPNTLQLLRTALNVLYATYILSYNNLSGLLLLLTIHKPKIPKLIYIFNFLILHFNLPITVHKHCLSLVCIQF